MARSKEGIEREVTVGNSLLSNVAENEIKKAWSGKMVVILWSCAASSC